MGFISNPSPIMGNDPNDLPRQIEVDETGAVKTTVNGSLTKLSTDPFPTEGVQNGWDLLEFYPDGSTKVYVYHDGWREI